MNYLKNGDNKEVNLKRDTNLKRIISKRGDNEKVNLKTGRLILKEISKRKMLIPEMKI